MLLGLLVLLTALAISSVAIYYSVAGLVAIFAAAAIPIMIMGTTLEIAKLVTAVWLHRYWREAKWWLKGYLSLSVVVLMFITSMGIFGFLSKAHIEQTANAQEGVAQIERIAVDIARQQDIIARAEERILDIESKGSNNDEGIQQQIDTEQQRIDSAYTRIQPSIDEQLAIVSKSEQDMISRIQPLLDQVALIETTLTDLAAALASNDVRLAQGIVGAKQDGNLGPNTSNKIQLFRENNENNRNLLLSQIEAIRTAPQPTVENARIEIARLRSIAEQQIADSDKLIARLRDRLGTEDVAAVDLAVTEQQTKIVEANNTIDTLTETKYTLQTEYRKLEAEVGPVKYLAEFIYGEAANTDMLEQAVRWVILIIIFVFDPLAVLLLIASQATFEMRRQEYPRLKAQQEIKNDNEINDHINDEHTQSRDTDSRHRKNGNNIGSTETINSANSDESTVDIATYAEWIGTADNGRNVDRSRREIELDEKEQTAGISEAKRLWKLDNPEENVKPYKELYIQGKIEELPWEGYVQNSEQNPDSLWNKIKRQT